MRRRIRAGMVALATALGMAFAAGAASADDPTAVMRWYGDTSSATGAALGSGACDVNGDGFDDAVVGAWFWDKAPNNNTGAAYVLLGGHRLAGGDLNTPEAAGAVRIDGPATANAFVGFSVACVGDVNGDGFDDIAISHYTAEKAYVVLGAEDFTTVDLGLLGDRGFEVHGDPTDALDYNVGFSMAPAGDLDDDGLDDFAIAGVVADTQGRTNNGRVWIVAGKEDVADVDLIAPQPGEILTTIDGAASEDRLGQIAPAGDVNGDGVDDVVLGAYTATEWGAGVAVPGAAWVLWGGELGPVDLASLGSRGFAVYGPKRQRDRLGISVAGVGDVDGDGLDDVLVGGDGVYNAATGQRPGSAWLIHGADSGKTVYTETDPLAPAAVYSCAVDDGSGVCGAGETEPRGYWIQGADSDPAGNGSEGTGYSIAGIGDVSGDGVPDFAIGAYGYDPQNPAAPGTTMSGAGAVWVVNGRAGTATQDLAALAADQGYRIDGLAAGDRFGRQVAALGDLDGNGSADFAAGGDFAQRPLPPGAPRTQAGEVAVALTGPLVTAVTLSDSAAAELEVGDSTDLEAAVELMPAPGGPVVDGTLTFTRDGDPIEGCEALPLDPVTGAAVCDGIAFPVPGDVALRALYSGTATRLGASSEPSSHHVRGPEPQPEEPKDQPKAHEYQPGEVFSAPRGEGPFRVGAAGLRDVVQIACPAATPCALGVSAKRLRIGGRSYGVTIVGPAEIAPGQSTSVSIRLGKAARQALAKAASKRRLQVTVTLVIGSGGGSVNSTLSLYLSPSKSKSKR